MAGRRIDAWLTVVAVVVATIVPALGIVATAPAPAADAVAASAIYQTDAFTATNVQRIRRSRVPLVPASCVQKWAVRQARKMAKQKRMFHQDLGRVVRDCGLSMAGENVAYGYSSGRSVVVDGWMRSEGHRANILRRNYRLMGIGARKAEDGTWYVAQVFGRKAG